MQAKISGLSECLAKAEQGCSRARENHGLAPAAIGTAADSIRKTLTKIVVTRPRFVSDWLIIEQQEMRDGIGVSLRQHSVMDGEIPKAENARVDDRHVFTIVAWMEKLSPHHWRGTISHIDPNGQITMLAKPFDHIDNGLKLVRQQLTGSPLPPAGPDEEKP